MYIIPNCDLYKEGWFIGSWNFYPVSLTQNVKSWNILKPILKRKVVYSKCYLLLFSSDHKHCLKCLHLLCSSFVAVLSVLFKHSNIVHKTKEANYPTFATEFYWKLLFSISFKIYFLIDSKIFHQTFTGAHGKYKIISFSLS